MAQAKNRDGRSGAGGRKAGGKALPVNLERSLCHLDDAQQDRLLDAAGVEARRRGRTDGRTPAKHDGSGAFTFSLAFSENLGVEDSIESACVLKIDGHGRGSSICKHGKNRLLLAHHEKNTWGPVARTPCRPARPTPEHNALMISTSHREPGVSSRGSSWGG